MFDEKKFVELVGPHIERCRPGDWVHAQKVVDWVKKIGEGREDLDQIVMAAYIHDIGWRGVFGGDRITKDKLLELEPMANENSEKFVREVMRDWGSSEDDIRVVLRLIWAADAHKSESDDEAVIVDSDNLSKLDIEHLRNKFEKGEWVKLLRMWQGSFGERIKTDLGQRVYPGLLVELEREILGL